MAVHFPEFRGPADDAEAVLKFFSDRFLELNPNEDERSIYVHATCATDTENVKIVDTVVQDIIMHKILGEVMID